MTVKRACTESRCPRMPKHFLRRFLPSECRVWKCPKCGRRWHTIIKTVPMGPQSHSSIEWRLVKEPNQ